MNVHRLTRISGVLAAILLASAALPASAHHSAAAFDMTKQVSLHGTVEKWLWANPHSWLYIKVVKPDGTEEIWGCEAGSTGMLARSGWSAADMKPGDEITVNVAPERGGQHIGLLNEVHLVSGKVLSAGPGAIPVPGGPGAPPPGFPGAPPAGFPGGPPPGPIPPGGPDAPPPGAAINAPTPR